MHSGGNSEEKKKELMTGKNKKQSQFARIDMLRKEDKIKKKNENRQSMKDFGNMIPDNSQLCRLFKSNQIRSGTPQPIERNQENQPSRL